MTAKAVRTELHGLSVLDQDLENLAGLGRRDRVHRLHGLDNHQRLAGRDGVAHLHEGVRARLRLQVDAPDHRRIHGVAGGAGRRSGFWGRAGGGRRSCGWRRRSDRRVHHLQGWGGQRLGHPDLQARMLDLDLRKAGLRQDVGQSAHEARVDGVGGGGLRRASHGIPSSYAGSAGQARGGLYSQFITRSAET